MSKFNCGRGASIFGGLAIFLMSAGGASAQPPAEIVIQGSLEIGPGMIVKGNTDARDYSVQFYSDSQGNNEVGGPITGSVIPSLEGRFAIEVSLPAGALVADSLYYSLAIDSNTPPNGLDAGDEFDTLIPVKSVPFALQSGEVIQRAENGTKIIELDIDDVDGGLLRMWEAEDGSQTVYLGVSQVEDSGGLLNLYDGAGDSRIFASAESEFGAEGPILRLRNSNLDNTVVLDGDEDEAGKITLGNGNSSNNRTTVEAQGNDGNEAGVVNLYDDAGVQTISLQARDPFTFFGNTPKGGRVELNNSDGDLRLVMDADSGNSAFLQVLKEDDSVGVNILGEDDSGNGTVTADEFITRGNDVSEKYLVRGLSSSEQAPGTVVSIDPNNAGDLRVSQKAYDTKVAGIISGAGDERPGMVLGTEIEKDWHPVALSGRVWVRADTSNGEIRPGDLLTTSQLPGYAARVGQHEKAHGAIIGKAMTNLQDGEGLVLVLVNLH